MREVEEERRNETKRNRKPSQGKEKKGRREAKAVAKAGEGFLFFHFQNLVFHQH